MSAIRYDSTSYFITATKSQHLCQRTVLKDKLRWDPFQKRGTVWGNPFIVSGKRFCKTRRTRYFGCRRSTSSTKKVWLVEGSSINKLSRNRDRNREEWVSLVPISSFFGQVSSLIGSSLLPTLWAATDFECSSYRAAVSHERLSQSFERRAMSAGVDKAFSPDTRAVLQQWSGESHSWNTMVKFVSLEQRRRGPWLVVTRPSCDRQLQTEGHFSVSSTGGCHRSNWLLIILPVRCYKEHEPWVIGRR